MSNNLSVCIDCVTAIESRQSENYIKLLNVTLDCLDVSLSSGKTLSPSCYKGLLKLVKVIFTDQYFADVAQRFVYWEALKHNDQTFMQSSDSVLQTLMKDLKSDFSTNDWYAALMLIRAENLRDVQANGSKTETTPQSIVGEICSFF